jgi:hypothetical protein
MTQNGMILSQFGISLLFERDPFGETGIHPGSSPGLAFSGSCFGRFGPLYSGGA